MGKKKPDVTIEKKNQIAQFLLSNSNNLLVENGKIKEVAEAYGVCRRTMHNIWAEAKAQALAGYTISFSSNKAGKERQKKKPFNPTQVTSISVNKRSTIRRLARELRMSKSHVGRWVKTGVIRAHTNAIKPALTEANINHRINFCLSHIQYMEQQQKCKFSEMYNVVHMDEKWFYMSNVSERYYLVPGEVEPYRNCKSKRFIPKIMFLCAVARPRFSESGECEFDGKIGMWPFTTTEPAQRSSKNIPKGTLVTKPLESITKAVIKDCLINKVIPAIKRKWPLFDKGYIFIQQDNAKPHINNGDEDFRKAATSDGFNMVLLCQPANSPDMNVCDLGWFRAIQSLQVETSSYNVDDLLKNVVISYNDLSSITLNNVFLTLQGCMVEVLKVKGTNNYKIPHMGKERLLREERLPISLEVEEQLVREGIQVIVERGQIEGLTYNISELIQSLAM